jgi:hypothetical protein
MQILKNKDNHLEIDTKKAVTVINDEVLVNGVKLEGAGEYEIGEVAIEGISDDIYLCQAEDIYIALVNFKEKLSKENIEKLSSVSLLISRVDGNLTDALEQIGQIEPNINVYVGGEEDITKLESAGVTIEKTENIKLSKTDMDTEKSYFVAVG